MLQVFDEKITRPIERECHKPVGVEGNKLRLNSFGMELEIPPGAIDSETPQDISFRVLTDTPKLGNNKEEMSVCFGVQCLAPDDLVLKLPVTYTIPHCAVITRNSSVETILYMGEGKYKPDSHVKERILLTKSGIPNCTVKKEVLELQMNHFSWAYIRFKIKNLLFREKRMRCWPFAEKELPAGRTPVILRAHLYDDVKGNKEIISQEECAGYAPVHPETEVLIRMAEVDVYMTCYIDCRQIVEPAIIRYDDLFRGHHRIKSFNLDLTRELDEVVVTLQVGQKEQCPEELLCKFSFTSLSRSTSLRTHDQVRPSQNANGSNISTDMDTLPSDPQSDMVYKMSTKPRGKALIVNNKDFTDKTLDQRKGTDVDCGNLDNIFKELGFTVTVNRNLKGEDIYDKIEQLSKEDHSRFDCLILAILSHGVEGAIHGTDGVPVKIEDIIKLFNADKCQTLKGKPKLFFIQACRGKGLDPGVEAPDGAGPAGEGGTKDDLKKEARMLLQTVEGDSTDGVGSAKSKLPSQSDMLLGYSIVPGFLSWRNIEKGSWFIQGLAEVIPKHAIEGEDLLSMMTMVNQVVARFESSCPDDPKLNRCKQASVCVSTLRKKLYFFPDH